MKKSLPKKTVLYAHPVFIVGSYDKNEVPNIMSVAWGGICCSDPPCVCISLRKATYTYHNIMENKAFTVNIPSVDYVKAADYVGISSGKNENKFEATGLTAVKSELVKAPYVREFPMSLICKLHDTVEIGLHTQFIGEILDVIADEELLNSKGMPIIEKVKPFIYDNSSRSYFEIGNNIGRAYSTRKEDLNI